MPDLDVKDSSSSARTVSQDDFDELGVIAESIMLAYQRDQKNQALRHLYHRLRHILLRIDGVRE